MRQMMALARIYPDLQLLVGGGFLAIQCPISVPEIIYDSSAEWRLTPKSPAIFL